MNQRLFLNTHHVEEHQAGVLILVLLCQMSEAVLFIEGNGREIGIDGDEAESGMCLLGMKYVFYSIHQ